MSDGLSAVEDWAGALLAQLAPPARAKLARLIATTLRKGQASRIAAQRDPDGAAFTPRKKQRTPLRGRTDTIKTGAMFKKLRLAKRLRLIQADANEASVGFTGRDAVVAAVHQHGERDRVGGPTSKAVTYPVRRLLGLTTADSEKLLELVLAHIDTD